MKDTKTPVNLRLDTVLLEEMDIKREACSLPKRTRTWWIEQCIKDNMEKLDNIIESNPKTSLVVQEKMKHLKAKSRKHALDREVNSKIKRLKKCSPEFIQKQIDKSPYYIAKGIYDFYIEIYDLNAPIDEKFLDI